MFSATSTLVIPIDLSPSFSMSAPFLPITSPGAPVDGDAALLVRTLDDDRETGACFSSSQDSRILMSSWSSLPYSSCGEPARIPGAVDAETQADRIDFLTHRFSSGLRFDFDLTNDDRQVGERLLDTAGRPRPHGRGSAS